LIFIFRSGGARLPLQGVRKFIDRYRGAYGVERICSVMQVAPAGYWRYAEQRHNLRNSRGKGFWC
jgi:hypothetical protein